MGWKRLLQFAAPLLVVAACSSGSESTATETTAPPTAPSTLSSTTAASTTIETRQDVESEVLAAFENYRQALLDRDGEAALTFASSNTVDWYDELLVLSLDADADTLLAAPMGDAVSVIVMRARIGDDLSTLDDGSELFVRGVELGLVGDNVATQQIEAVEPGADHEAFGLIGGFPVMRFVDETTAAEPDWRFDMPFTIETTFSESNEDEVIAALSGGTASTRLEFYELLAAGYGTTWDDLSQPIT